MYKSIIISFILSLSYVHSQSIIDWNKNERLKYENFKKKPFQTKIPQGFLDSKLGWQIAETDGEIPKVKVFNRFDEINSWISIKHVGILNEMQLQFDLSELYARKIRKDFEELQAKKVMDNSNNLKKRLKSMASVSINQPDLYNLLNKQIQDSLFIYKSYSN